MFDLWKSLIALNLLFMCGICASTACAADPGIPLVADGAVSDQKTGSVLLYSFYTSGIISPDSQNTQFTVTNTHPTEAVAVRFYFVLDVSGTFSLGNFGDTPICLAPNQTESFHASDFIPGVSGYAIAFAIGLGSGCPISFNYLTGSARVVLPTGHVGSFDALAAAARYSGAIAGCSVSTPVATLNFDGNAAGYDRLPRVLAIDKLASRSDRNDTFLVVNRFGGNLQTAADPIGFLQGTLYDESGARFDFASNPGNVRQFSENLSNSFPLFENTTFDAILPTGRRGWMKFWATSNYALFGAVINLNLDGQTRRSAFNGGQILRALTLTDSATLTIPVFQAAC